MNAPKNRIDWKNGLIGAEKQILKEWADGEITTTEACYQLSRLHRIKDRYDYYKEQDFIENAHWLGWFR